MAAPYRTAEPPDESAESAELAAFEREVSVMPRWLRLGYSHAHEWLFHSVVLQLLAVAICAASPLGGALAVPAALMAVPSLAMAIARYRRGRRR